MKNNPDAEITQNQKKRASHKTRALRSQLNAKPASPPEHAEQQCRQENDDENKEQDLGDFCRARRNPAEAEESSHERDDEEYDSVPKHEASHGGRLVG
jgi:hypothetical protein